MPPLREGSPFMEFISIVVLCVLSGAALVFLSTVALPAAAETRAFLVHVTDTLIGAVIALAYAANRMTTNINVKKDAPPE